MRVRLIRCNLAVCLLGSFLALTGCSKNADKDAQTPQAAVEAKEPGSQTQSAQSQPSAKIALASFKDAVLFEPPEGEQRPPDRTFAGKNVGALFEEIAGQEGTIGAWDNIALSTADGKRLRYTARLKTDLGNIDIELFADAAPNHVRNFVALALSGYYNGLPFHRSLSKEVDGQRIGYVEGGCPLGTGEFGFGSIGYWLKPEIAPTLTHEEGTVGAARGASEDSAACKFYISLTKAPGMDGNYTIFGKVTKGLDVAGAINKRPAVDDEDMSDRPKEPVIIRGVTIQAVVQDGAIVARNP